MRNNQSKNEQAEGSPLEDLRNLRRQLCEDIANALIRDDKSSRSSEAFERLRRGDALIDQAINLWRGEKSLADSSTPTPPPNDAESAIVAALHHESAKARGEKVRSEWVESKLGKLVNRLRGVLHRNSKGDIIGIAYAREKESRKGRWFLGLPDRKFQSAMLLCQSSEDRINAACLQRGFIDAHYKQLSKSHGQVKFMVVKRSGKWWLSVPSVGDVNITDYIDNYSLVV